MKTTYLPDIYPPCGDTFLCGACLTSHGVAWKPRQVLAVPLEHHILKGREPTPLTVSGLIACRTTVGGKLRNQVILVIRNGMDDFVASSVLPWLANRAHRHHHLNWRLPQHLVPSGFA